MNTYEINKTFPNNEACKKWEDENLTVDGREMYNGEYILMVCHEASSDSDEVKITTITTV